MNKAHRHQIKMLKYKKRIKKYGINDKDGGKYYAFRSHGAPCSCSICSHTKYNRAAEIKKFCEQFYNQYGDMMSKLANE